MKESWYQQENEQSRQCIQLLEEELLTAREQLNSNTQQAAALAIERDQQQQEFYVQIQHELTQAQARMHQVHVNMSDMLTSVS